MGTSRRQSFSPLGERNCTGNLHLGGAGRGLVAALPGSLLRAFGLEVVSLRSLPFAHPPCGRTVIRGVLT